MNRLRVKEWEDSRGPRTGVNRRQRQKLGKGSSLGSHLFRFTQLDSTLLSSTPLLLVTLKSNRVGLVWVSVVSLTGRLYCSVSAFLTGREKQMSRKKGGKRNLLRDDPTPTGRPNNDPRGRFYLGSTSRQMFRLGQM